MATYTKLRSGYWGIRVSGSAAPGDRVEVTTKDGRRKTETVSRVVWSGDGVTICDIVPRDKQSGPRRIPGCGRMPGERAMTGVCWECGGRMPRYLADQGETCNRC